MIRRLLDRLARRLMDRDWLAEMWFRGETSRQEARDLDRRDPQDDERPPASDQWPSREWGRR